MRSRVGKMIGNKEKMRKMRGELLYPLTALELWIVLSVHCTSCAGFGMSPQHTLQPGLCRYHKGKDRPQRMTPWRYWNGRM